MALTGGKPTRTYHRREQRLNVGILAGVACYAGGLAMAVAGYVRPARVGQGGNDAAKLADVSNCRVIGYFDASAIGGSNDGDVTVDTVQGAPLLKNSAGVDAITIADIGRYAFVVDDETVAKHSAGGIRPRAGTIIDVTAEGVFVEVGPVFAAGPGRTIVLPFFINETDTLAPTNAELVSPVSGRISRMNVIVQKAVTTGGDVTALVGTTAVDGLACTIADAATKGTVVSDTPTLGHASTVVAAGDRIQIAPGAAFNTAGALSGFIEISY